jgi:hypothetical protein
MLSQTAWGSPFFASGRKRDWGENKRLENLSLSIIEQSVDDQPQVGLYEQDS